MSAERAEISPPIKFFPETLGHMALDHDGVVQDRRTQVTEIFNKKYKTNHTPDEIKDWRTLYKWALAVGLDKEKAEEVEHQLWYRKNYLLEGKPVPGVVEFLRKAYELGFKIPILSSRLTSSRSITLEWYERNDMSFIGEENIFTGLSDVSQEMIKPWMILLRARAFSPIRLYIEDSPQHAQPILTYTDASVILLSNDTVLDHYLGERLFRVSSQNGTLPDMWPVYHAFFG